jgi:imidazolonepropionase
MIIFIILNKMNSIIKLTGSSRGFATSLKLTNIKCLVGINKENKLTKHSNAEVAIKNGKIVEIAEAGKSKKLEGTKFKVIDTQGALVTPAFVDPHTHLFPPNDRANEFSLRGTTSYEEIAKQGGGIMSSVKAMREASFDEIYKANERIIKRFIS